MCWSHLHKCHRNDSPGAEKMARPRPCWLPNTVSIFHVCFSTGILSLMVLLGSLHTHICAFLVLVVAFRVFTWQETQDMNMSANTCTYILTHVCMHTYRKICGLCRKNMVCWDRQKTSQQPPEQARFWPMSTTAVWRKDLWKLSWFWKGKTTWALCTMRVRSVCWSGVHSPVT